MDDLVAMEKKWLWIYEGKIWSPQFGDDTSINPNPWLITQNHYWLLESRTYLPKYWRIIV